MCNNFLKYLIFEYQKFPVKDSSMQVNDDETILANSGHVKQLYYLELGKPVKMAHTLNDKILNPSSLEKTSVNLADSFFHESTINALAYYANNGYPEFNGTVDFLKLIRNWFNTMNVKTAFYGQEARDERRDPIRNNDRTGSLIYLQKIL